MLCGFDSEFYDIELSESICTAISRWQAFSGKTAILEGEDGNYSAMRSVLLGNLGDAA